MSAILPPAPSPMFPTQSPGAPFSPARASRSDFFKAALDSVLAGTAAAPEAAQARPTAAAAPSWVEERLQRPGSLLDIRV